MDRVETLLNQIKEQIAGNASVDEVLVTVQMLQSELLHLKSTQKNQPGQTAVRIDIPSFHDAEPPPPQPEEEKIIEVLQVDEAEIEAELDEIKKNVEALAKMSSAAKPQLLFDPVEDTPTLTHQQMHVESKKEVHQSMPAAAEGDSLNDRLKQSKIELSDSLHDAIKDLKKAIGVNDRFLFINELFRGDEVMYERSIKTINGFSILPEAEFWIRRELKLKLGWSDVNPVVKQFDQLVKRRFSSM